MQLSQDLFVYQMLTFCRLKYLFNNSCCFLLGENIFLSSTASEYLIIKQILGGLQLEYSLFTERWCTFVRYHALFFFFFFLLNEIHRY